MGEHLDWFPFYPGKWLTDDKVLVLSDDEQGLYVRALCVQWINPWGLAVDREKFSRTLRVPDVSDDLLDCFPVVKKEDCRQNPRLEQVRTEQRKRYERYRTAGKRGATARWQGDDDANGDANGDAMPEASISRSREGKGRGGDNKDAVKISEYWNKFREAYPPRSGGQRWPAAQQSFVNHWKKGLRTKDALLHGEDAGACLVAVAAAYHRHCNKRKLTGTEHVMQAATFLNRGGGWLEDWDSNGGGKPVPSIPEGR